MAGFTSLDDVIDAVSNLGQVLDSSGRKLSLAPEAVGVWHSMWRVGSYPGAGGDGAAGSGSANSGGTALTLADGSLSRGWADQSGKQKHLLCWDAWASVATEVVLLDRLVSVSGITLVGTGSKNVNSVPLPRYTGTDSKGVRAFLEVTTVTATAAVVGTASYTDQDGNAGSTSPAYTFPAVATNVDTMVPIDTAAGDSGMRSIETLNLTTASGGSGACNLILVRELARMPLEAAGSNTRDFLSQLGSLPRVFDGASLMLALIASSTTAVTVDSHINAAYR